MKILLLLFITFAAAGHPGIGIVRDSKGNVFYTDLQQVWKINTAGKKSIAVRNVHTHELYLDDQDNLFGEHVWYNGEAANTWGHYVWRLTASGKLEKVIPDTEGFRDEFSFVRDHLGRTYQSMGEKGCQHIARTNLDQTISTMGNACIRNIRWMTSSPMGHVYLVDELDVKKIDPFGQLTVLARNVAQPKSTQLFVSKDHYLAGITLDKKQNVYVCDFSAHDIKKITPSGNVSVMVEITEPWAPTGLLIDEKSGEWWILECSVTNNVRVEKLDKQGKRTVF
jgi:hypothetical protein